MKAWSLSVLSAVVMAFPAPAQQVSGRDAAVFAEVGKSDGRVTVLTLGVNRDLGAGWRVGSAGELRPFVEIAASYWEGDEGHTGNDSLHEAGISALLRCKCLRPPHARVRPYAEAGFGLHYLTENRIESKELGRQWLAGSDAGIGLLFFRDERLEIGLRIRHLSNAGTDEMNWGVNQALARAAFRF